MAASNRHRNSEREARARNSGVKFPGTEIGLKTLVDCIEAGLSIDDFIEGFPAVSRKQAIEYLRLMLETTERQMSAYAVPAR